MFDLALKNGIIVDGTRSEPYKGNVYIKNGKIGLIDRHNSFGSKKVLDCSGNVISPGFIDIHTHIDACPLNKKEKQSLLNEGTTFALGGNCGISLIPSNDESRKGIQDFFNRTVEIVPEDKNLKINNMKDYIKLTEGKPLPINYALLVGHGTLRASVMGFEDRKPTKDELEKMKASLDEEMKNGAFGMSLGLIYPPSSYGDVDEFTELAKVIKKNNGILSVHMRSESTKIFEAVNEMLEVAEKSGVHLQISHLKLMGKPQWGRSADLLNKINKARSQGIDVNCDQYPYDASSTGLAALVPDWALSGGNEAMLENLKAKTGRLIKDMEDILEMRGGASRVLIASTHDKLPEVEGKRLSEIAEENNSNPIDEAIRILMGCGGGVQCVYFCMDLDDVCNIIKDMDIAVCSDSTDFSYDVDYNPHPRNFGTMPRFFQTVRERNIMSIEDAVYKATGLPAKILHLPDRGVLKKGNIADITVFNYKEITDMSTYLESVARPKGITHVLIRGIPVMENEVETGNMSGKTILK